MNGASNFVLGLLGAGTCHQYNQWQQKNKQFFQNVSPIFLKLWIFLLKRLLAAANLENGHDLAAQDLELVRIEALGAVA
jgi:hypothetical protein